MPESRVAVVIPAYQEAALIAQTLSSIPPLVDEIFVVDDGSRDETARIAEACGDARTHVIRHRRNRGVGAAICSGYQAALTAGATILVVMAGDNQMDGDDLPRLLDPVLRGQADYVKGNRLVHPRAKDMPLLRRVGTAALARITSWISGHRIFDSQCGFTVITAQAARSLEDARVWPGYGYPNDMILSLAARGCRIAERPVRPVYSTEKSGLRPWHFLLILGVILRRIWLEREWGRHLEKECHGELSS